MDVVVVGLLERIGAGGRSRFLVLVLQKIQLVDQLCRPPSPSRKQKKKESCEGTTHQKIVSLGHRNADVCTLEVNQEVIKEAEWSSGLLPTESRTFWDFFSAAGAEEQD